MSGVGLEYFGSQFREEGAPLSAAAIATPDRQVAAARSIGGDGPDLVVFTVKDDLLRPGAPRGRSLEMPVGSSRGASRSARPALIAGLGGLGVPVLLVAASVACSGSELMAQVRSGPANVDDAIPSVELPATAEEIDARIAQLETRRNEIRQRLEPGEGPAADAAGSASPHELEDKRRLLQQWIIAIEGEQRTLSRLKGLRRFHQDRAEEEQAWHGFSQAPPHPLRFVERLRDEVAAQRLEQRTHQVMVSIQEGEVARFAARLADNRKELRLARDGMEQSPDPRGDELAELRVQANAASAEAAEVEHLFQVEDLNAQRRYLDFLERKLDAAQAESRFTRADLDAELSDVRARREELLKDLAKAMSAATTAQKSLDAARTALRSAQQQPASQGREAPPALLQATVEMRQTVAETAELRIDVLRGLMQLTRLIEGQWNDRFWLTSQPGLVEIREKNQLSAGRMKRLRSWSEFVESSLSTSVAEASSCAVRATSATLPASEQQLARQEGDSLQERASAFQQAQAALSLAIALEERLQAELIASEASVSLAGRGRALVDGARLVLRRVWDSELYIAEENVIADGRKISIPRSVTVGKVLLALTIFLTGLLLARLAYGLVHGIAARLLKRTEHVAAIWGKTTAACVVLGALLFAMTSVRIPWTIFAFLGGALAIGLGFGGQALISNFISGIILLLERRIRVGDLVEIDGQRGHIVRIGVRSSLIKRSDGVEMLVPNSRFLDRNVVNWTLSDNLAQFSVSVGVAHGSPTSKVADLIGQTVVEDGQVLRSPPPVVLFEEFGERGLVFTVRFWLQLRQGIDHHVVCSDLRHRIDAALRQAGIELARPYGILDTEEWVPGKTLGPTGEGKRA